MSEKNKNNAVICETVYIPKESRHDDALFVSVNGQRILIKKGESVSIPAKYAEVIRNSDAAREEAESFICSVSRT